MIEAVYKANRIPASTDGNMSMTFLSESIKMVISSLMSNISQLFGKLMWQSTHSQQNH